MENLKEITAIINSLKSEDEIYSFFKELFSDAELADLSKRWSILKLLKEGHTQRDIAKELKVSLCKITRGSKILKDKNAIVTKYLRK